MPTARAIALAGALLALAALGLAAAQDDNPQRVANVSLEDEDCPEGPDRFCVQPGSIELEEGTDLVLHVTNEGRIEHNLTFAHGSQALADRGTNGTLAPGESQRVRVPWQAFEDGLADGQTNATLHCGRDGHAALGERLRVEVPSLAASEERPQPAPGAWALLAVLAGAALVRRRK